MSQILIPTNNDDCLLWKLHIYKDGEKLEGNVFSSSFDIVKGNVNDPFNTLTFNTASLTTEIELFEGEVVSFRLFRVTNEEMDADDYVPSLYDYVFDDYTVKSKTSSRGRHNYYLGVDTYNVQCKKVNWGTKMGTHVIMFGDKKITYIPFDLLVKYAFQELNIPLPQEIDSEKLYPSICVSEDVFDITKYTLSDLWKMYCVCSGITFADNAFDDTNYVYRKHMREDVESNEEKYGIDFVKLNYSYIKFDVREEEGDESRGIRSRRFAEVNSYDSSIVFDKNHKTGGGVEEGNGIIIDLPSTFYYDEGEGKTDLDIVGNNLNFDILSKIDLSSKSMTVVGSLEYLNMIGKNVKTSDYEGNSVDGYYEFDTDSENYEDFLNDVYNSMLVSSCRVVYTGGLRLEMSNGSGFSGSAENQGNTYSVNVSTQSTSADLTDIYQSIRDIYKRLQVLDKNVVDVSSIANILSSVDYLTINSPFYQNIQTQTVTADSISAKFADMDEAEIEKLTANNAFVTEINTNVVNADTIATKVLESKELKTDIATIADAQIGKATITDAQISSINGNKITDGSILAKALSSSAISTLSGTTVFYQADTPTAKKEGDIWYHTVVDSEEGTKWSDNVSVWDGSSWVETPLDAKMLLAGSITSREIDVEQLFAQEITASDFHLTGGSIEIETDNSYSSIISLSHGLYSSVFMPSGLEVENGEKSNYIGASYLYLKNTLANNYSNISSGGISVGYNSDSEVFSLGLSGININDPSDNYNRTIEISPVGYIKAKDIYENGTPLEDKYALKGETTKYTYNAETKTLRIDGNTVSYDADTKTLAL